MNNPEYFKDKWTRPKSDFTRYQKTQEAAVQDFLKVNKVFEFLDGSSFTMRHYHGLLKSIFHQVYFSSTSFAISGAMSSTSSVAVRRFLLHHAEEEMDHWQWILQDLKATGYKGPDPREEHAHWAAQAYLSYGVYLAFFNPTGRLAMAQVLEGISSAFGSKYGGKALENLKIPREHAKFFLLHGELDQGHAREIGMLLENESLSPEGWSDLEHVARTTSILYKNLYNASMENIV